MSTTDALPRIRRECWRATVALAVGALWLAGCATPRFDAQGVGERNITDVAKVPAGYQTYTLFISTSYDYAKLKGVDALTKQMSGEFDAFAKEIGAENFAVFVSSTSSGKLDVAAGRTVLDRISQWYGGTYDYQNGPYIIVLPTHPLSPPPAGTQAAVIAFNGRAPDDVRAVVTELRAELSSTRAKTAPTTDFGTFWLAVRDGWLQVGASPVRHLAELFVTGPSGT